MNQATGAALRAILAEMDRQAADMRASFAGNGAAAGALARSARRTGRLVLLGMGGSHAVNRVAEPLYRRAGLDATALPASEMLRAPLPLGAATVVLASQSGESGEIVACLALPGASEDRFGLTLNAESALARAVPCLIGAGGMEQAFAATRSLCVSLALHARVLNELGQLDGDALDLPDPPPESEIRRAAERLGAVRAVLFSAARSLQGVAEAAALGMLELARLPAFALENGQFRHGPLEALGPDLGIVLLRAADDGAASQRALAATCAAAGSPTLILDASGQGGAEGALCLELPPAEGMAAALAILPPLQRMLIEVARRRVSDVGAPLRSAKITRDA